ncbi:hypothetical protein FB446DRAFT_843871 [Lentinula raphanica]|nr:hypothetical protein FB446DRAFT_843871 [Lentinula raphanica]
MANLPGKPLPSATEALQQIPVNNTSNINSSLEHLESDPLNAYDICLEFERKAVAMNAHKEVMYARILGYMVLYAPLDTALREVSHVIHNCSPRFSDSSSKSAFSLDDGDFEKLAKIGETFLLFFIRPFKRLGKGHSLPSFESDDSSRQPLDCDEARMQESVEGAKSSYEKAKIAALHRDGYRCVVTGLYDSSASGSISDEDIFKTEGIVHTQLAHIVPICYQVDTPSHDLCEKEYAASFLAILKRFGYDVDKINGDKVHSLFNVMTLEMNTHDWFNRLGVYFEKTAAVNRYCLLAIDRRIKPPSTVIFSTPDPDTYPVPDPELLALHATCAKVAHFSGAGEYLDKLDNDEETIGVLASDGGSAEILNHAILRSVVRGANCQYSSHAEDH